MLDAILPLMGLPPYKGVVVPTISDQLADTYYRFLDRVKDYPVDVLSRDLKPLAKACYWLLVARIQLESDIMHPCTPKL